MAPKMAGGLMKKWIPHVDYHLCSRFRIVPRIGSRLHVLPNRLEKSTYVSCNFLLSWLMTKNTDFPQPAKLLSVSSILTTPPPIFISRESNDLREFWFLRSKTGRGAVDTRCDTRPFSDFSTRELKSQC